MCFFEHGDEQFMSPKGVGVPLRQIDGHPAEKAGHFFYGLCVYFKSGNTPHSSGHTGPRYKLVYIDYILSKLEYTPSSCCIVYRLDYVAPFKDHFSVIYTYLT